MTRKTQGTVARPRMADERRWRAENALSTLTSADEIKRNAGLMRDVKRIARQRAQQMSRIGRRAK